MGDQARGQLMIEGIEQISGMLRSARYDFRIVMVDLHGTMIEPKQLKEISKLEHVRELYIPARIWSPGERRQSSIRA